MFKIIISRLPHGKMAAKQVKFTITIAVFLGIISSSIQIFLDYKSTLIEFKNNINQIAETIKSPAALSAFNYDEKMAGKTLRGLTPYSFIYNAAIINEDKETIASYYAERVTEKQRWFTDFVFGRSFYLEKSLTVNRQVSKDDGFDAKSFYVGELQIQADTFVMGDRFTSRAVTTLMAGLLKNFLLALSLLVFFQYHITSPLMGLVSELKSIDPKHSEQKQLELVTGHYQDELEVLNNTINELIDAINCYFTEKIASIKDADRMKADIVSRRLREELMKKQQEKLGIANQQLANTLETLKKTQRKLIEREKFASLGELVAGVAHELNTPIGIGITSSSLMLETNQRMENKFHNNEFTKCDLLEFFNTVGESAKLTFNNLKTAANLVANFKEVSKDRQHEERYIFSLLRVIQDTLNKLPPELHASKHDIKIDCEEDIWLDSYPHIFSQIFSHLFVNSLIHGFSAIEHGTINIGIQHHSNRLIIQFIDNGIGMEDDGKKIFEPFYTTRRFKGSIGLGGTILYNLVNHVLEGSIDCCLPKKEAGVQYNIVLDLLGNTVQLVDAKSGKVDR